MISFARQPHLPLYSTAFDTIPPGWGHGAREGIVVRFSDGHDAWTVNVEGDPDGRGEVWAHPDGERVVVISGNDLWVFTPQQRQAERWPRQVTAVVDLSGSADRLLAEETTVARLGAGGLVWRSPPVSRDGVTGVRVEGGRVVGCGWEVPDDEVPFVLDLDTGLPVDAASSAGSDATLAARSGVVG